MNQVSDILTFCGVRPRVARTVAVRSICTVFSEREFLIILQRRDSNEILLCHSRNCQYVRIRYAGAGIPCAGNPVRVDMEHAEMDTEVFLMKLLIGILFNIAIIAIVIAFLPQILAFIAVCFALACAFSFATGLNKSV